MDVKSKILQWKGEIDQESIDIYKFLQKQFPIDDNIFRFVYRSFYGLDNAGLSEECKQEYFGLFKKRETSLQKILEALYHFKTRKGFNTYQFSFATKLIHTIDNNAPIYDSKVHKLFKFPPRKKEIKWCINTYNLLKEKYASLLQDNQVQQRIKELKEKYSTQDLSDTKMLDFILWTIGKEEEKK